MSDQLEPYICPQCKQLVKSDEKSIADHYSTKEHNKGLYVEAPQAQEQGQPQAPQTFQPRAYNPNPPPGAYPTLQRWPQANIPQLPPTRFLGWWDQIKGMWFYYRKGMVYFGLIVALATIALLTRL